MSLAGGAIAAAGDPALAAMPRDGLLHVAPGAAPAGGAGQPHEPAPHDQLSITPECLLVSAAAAVAQQWQVLVLVTWRRQPLQSLIWHPASLCAPHMCSVGMCSAAHALWPHYRLPSCMQAAIIDGRPAALQALVVAPEARAQQKPAGRQYARESCVLISHCIGHPSSKMTGCVLCRCRENAEVANASKEASGRCACN